MAIISLPPGSTSSDLQAAIDTAASDDIIELSSNMEFTQLVTMPAGKVLTIQSTAGNRWAMSMSITTPDIRHFEVLGTLILNNIIVRGNATEQNLTTQGGVQVDSGGIFTLNSGAVIESCASSSNGGAIYANGGTININEGGSIIGNFAQAIGGGIYLTNTSTLNLTEGLVNNNVTGSTGGGIYALRSTVTIVGSEVNGNEATGSSGGGIALYDSIANIGDSFVNNNIAGNSGGGIYINETVVTITGSEINGNKTVRYDGGGIILQNTQVNITDSQISSNSAQRSGGGIYVAANAILTVSGASKITGNAAVTGEGGGIYTNDFDYNNPADLTTYQNIFTDSTTVFSENRASTASFPPTNASQFDNIGYASSSISFNGVDLHPLNNYDINYVGRLLEFFTVTYNPNGGAGDIRIDANLPTDSMYRILTQEEAGFSRSGYLFAGWNTEPGGGGTTYQPNTTIQITGNLVLYAQWTQLLEVVYNANGGIGNYVDTNIIPGSEYTILSPEQVQISRTDYTFTGWNTQPNGGGTTYQPGTTIVITQSLTLYAQWEATSPQMMQYLLCCCCSCDSNHHEKSHHNCGGRGRHVLVNR